MVGCAIEHTPLQLDPRHQMTSFLKLRNFNREILKGASVYSASDIARTELPGVPASLAGAVSIARRYVLRKLTIVYDAN